MAQRIEIGIRPHVELHCGLVVVLFEHRFGGFGGGIAAFVLRLEGDRRAGH